jgi:hypothetical protein
MGFVLLLLGVCVLISLISFFSSDHDFDSTALGFIIPLVISFVIMCIVWSDSYCDYVSMQENKVNIEQYAQTIDIYSKRGVAEFKDGEFTGAEITDLKYNNYQHQLGKMIIDLRNRVRDYNEELVGKTVMKKSWFWSWCIIAPIEGSIVLNMSDYID